MVCIYGRYGRESVQDKILHELYHSSSLLSTNVIGSKSSRAEFLWREMISCRKRTKRKWHQVYGTCECKFTTLDPDSFFILHGSLLVSKSRLDKVEMIIFLITYVLGRYLEEERRNETQPTDTLAGLQTERVRSPRAWTWYASMKNEYRFCRRWTWSWIWMYGWNVW